MPSIRTTNNRRRSQKQRAAFRFPHTYWLGLAGVGKSYHFPLGNITESYKLEMGSIAIPHGVFDVSIDTSGSMTDDELRATFEEIRTIMEGMI